MEVFDEHVGLLGGAVTSIDVAIDIVTRLKQSQGAFLQKEFLIDLILLFIDQLCQVTDVLEEAKEAFDI